MLDLESLVRAWSLSAGLHSFGPPASEPELAALETSIGRRLPPSFRGLYLLSDGADLLAGNLRLFPLEDSVGLGVTNAAAKLRSWHRPLPEDVLVFADDGSDGLFGLWLPEASNRAYVHPILEIGETSAPNGYAVAATDLLPFLCGWSAYYLMLYEAGSDALDALGLPTDLRRHADDLDDETFAQLRHWADPDLPDPNPDPYNHGYDVAQLRALFTSL